MIRQITTSWHEKGRVEGKVEAKREVICKYLVRKFGDKSSDMQQKVQQITSLEVLDYILEELFAVSTLEEARATVNNGAGNGFGSVIPGGVR